MHDSASAVGRLALMGTLLWGLAGCAATPDAPAEAAAPKVAPLPGGLPAEPVGVNKELGPPSRDATASGPIPSGGANLRSAWASHDAYILLWPERQTLPLLSGELCEASQR